MGKIVKKYIGSDQVGASQIELENNSPMRAKSFDGLSSFDLMEVDPSDLLQMLRHPYLPADAVNPLQAATKQQVDAVSDAKANVNLDNLAAGDTSIPAGVDLRSLETDQSNGFRIFTANQASSNSGALQIRTGTTEAAAVSGSVSIFAGINATASGAAATTVVTGGVTIRSGSITGGTQGSTGLVLIGSAGVSSSVTGNSGIVEFTTGSNAGVGSSGIMSIRSGESSNAAGSASGVTNIGTGRSLNGASGAITLFTGSVSAAASYPGALNNSAGLAATGAINLASGSISNVLSAAVTGSLNLTTGSHSGTGNSGDINLSTGSISSGVRGKVSITSSIVEINSQLDMQANKIVDLADPTLDQDAATKAYVDAQVVAGITNEKEAVVLDATDITNQYVDLANEYIPKSTWIGVGARVNLYEGLDFTISVVSSVTRITFIGPSATAGAEALADGDILYVQGILA